MITPTTVNGTVFHTLFFFSAFDFQTCRRRLGSVQTVLFGEFVPGPVMVGEEESRYSFGMDISKLEVACDFGFGRFLDNHG